MIYVISWLLGSFFFQKMAESTVSVNTPHISTIFLKDKPKGYDDELPEQSTKSGTSQCRNSSRLRSLADAVTVCSVIGPLVVVYWRGTWGIMDIFVFPYDVERSSWTCIGLGFGVIFFYMNLQEPFQRLLSSCSLDKSLVFIWFLFVYLMAFCVVASWRGIWYLLDHFFTTSKWNSLASHIIGVSIMVVSGTFMSVIGAPGYVLRDQHIQPISFNLTVVGTSHLPQKNLVWKGLSYLFTVVIIGSGVICYWRGTWTLLNNFFPKGEIKYPLIGLAVGYATVLCCYCVTTSDTARVKLESNGIGRLARLSENLFLYFLAFGVVNVWKGYWDLVDILSLNMPGQSNQISLGCHVVGFVGLFALRASINLVGCPAGCRVSRETRLDGFDMGSFLDGLFEVQVFHNTQVKSIVEREVVVGIVTVM